LKSTFAASDSTRQHQVLRVNAASRNLECKPLQDFEVERVPFGLPPITFGFACGNLRVQARLNSQCVRNRRRIEHQPQHRIQQLAEEPEQRVRRIVQRRFVERIRLRAAGRRHVYRDGSFPGAAAKLIEELRFEAAGIENRLEPAPGEFLNLLVRQLHAASLRDTRANLAHDLFDVYAVVRSGRFPDPAEDLAGVRVRADRDRGGRDESARGVPGCDPSPSRQYSLNNWPHSVRMNSRMRERPIVGYHTISWYTFEANGAHTISGECRRMCSSGRRKPFGSSGRPR
jgi:hypothetical protein